MLLLGMAFVAVLGLFLYADSLNLLLFWDDVPHMQWLATQRGGNYWLTSEGFPFYRPTAFTIWDMMERVNGEHNPRWLHALSVGLHTINALLLSVLIRMLSPNALAAVLAGLVFVAFPFSYQTVIPTAAHFHLWLVFGVLSSAILCLLWLTSKRRWLLVGGWLCAFWAIFSHESGVLTPILLLGFLLLHTRTISRHALQQIATTLSIPAVFAALYLSMWAAVPKANDATHFQLTALDVKIGQTLQAIGYPIAALLQHILSPDDGTVLAWLSGMTVLGLLGVWVYWHREQWLSVGFFVLWIPAVMLPAWLFLDASYLLGSPRLHYLASVGIAALWGQVAAQPLPPRFHFYLQGSIGLGLIGVLMAVSIPFVQARHQEHVRIDNIYRDVQGYADTLSNGESMLLVNGPAYLAPSEATFLLGAEGSTYLPDFITLQDWLWLNGTTQPISADNQHAPDITPSYGGIFAVTHPQLNRNQIAEYDTVITIQNHRDELRAFKTGQRNEPIPASYAGYYEEGLFVSSVTLKQENDMLVGEIIWQHNGISEPLSIFVHLLCNGVLVAQADGPPLGRLYPLELWDMGETWRDLRYFSIDQALSTDCLQLFVGLFNPHTGERYIIIDTEGNRSDGIYSKIEPSTARTIKIPHNQYFKFDIINVIILGVLSLYL